MKHFTELDLTPYNSYRVRAVAANVYFPETAEDVAVVFSNGSRPRVILGGGYNVILSKPRYDDMDFVIFNETFGAITVEGNLITAQPGASLKRLSETACEHGLTGLELFFDVPGTAGGAVFMNAETLGESFGDVVDTVTWFDRSRKLFQTDNRQGLGFGYRTSFFQSHPEAIVTDVRLKLACGDKAAITQKMKDNEALRHQKQPWDIPNAGSVFRRPPGRFVGQMMDELKLKGATCGGAMVSPKHGGFIVNYNNKATGQDILDLIKLIQDRVYEAYQIKLELEQRII